MLVDRRSTKIAVVAHCLLNQNAKVAGLAGYPGLVEPLVSLLSERGLGIIQMPCPERLHLGPDRPLGTDTREQYDTPGYRAVCRRIANQVTDEVVDYVRAGYTVPFLLGVEGSPSCSVSAAPRLDEAGERCLMPGQGLFIEALGEAFERAELALDIVGVPETGAAGSLEACLSSLERMLTGGS